MVGLNHEMARELLWREYPTDQRGTPFRAVLGRTRGPLPSRARRRRSGASGCSTSRRSTPGPRSRRWATTTTARPGEKDDELVLVIRGELLKKYPTAVIYAHRAEWRPAHGGTSTRPRSASSIDLDPGRHRPAAGQSRLPLYEAKVEPDIYFFGFDLTADEARGESGEHPATTPAGSSCSRNGPATRGSAWTSTASGTLQVWNDLAWPDVLTGPPSGAPRYLTRREYPGAHAGSAHRSGECQGGAVRGGQGHPLERPDRRRRPGLHPLPGARAGRRAREGDAPRWLNHALGESSRPWHPSRATSATSTRCCSDRSAWRRCSPPPSCWCGCSRTSGPSTRSSPSARTTNTSSPSDTGARCGRPAATAALRLSAWRDLVNSAGAGRAKWIAENRKPLNPQDEPHRIGPDHVILVVADDDPLPAADRPPARTYWTAIYRAAGAEAAVQAADSALQSAVGSTRATRIRARRPAGMTQCLRAVWRPPRSRWPSWTCRRLRRGRDQGLVVDGGSQGQAAARPVHAARIRGRPTGRERHGQRRCRTNSPSARTPRRRPPTSCEHRTVT